MGKINVLGFDVANLIAAGEVVDRPASIVKELIENAIDSGADEVTVEIKNGGISHIRVSDNGCGISSEDLPLSVLRHATSKIAKASDLETISTLGFRGEARAAIAAVTKLKIYSRTEGSEMGSLLVCEGGEVIEFTDTGCRKGTTVIADEIFFNVPARRKFLKRDATECAKITDIVEKTALSVPDISLKYIVDGEIRFITRGDGDLKGAVHSVLGKRIAERLVRVDRSENGVRVSGYVSEVDLVFSKRSEEIFFVNGRCIRNPILMSALERAYISKIPDDKFPMCVLNISLSPEAVDVNVHPTKLEVKFSNERIVSEALHFAVLTALNCSNSRPELKLGRETAPRAPEVPALDRRNAERILGAFAPVEKTSADKETQISLDIPKSVGASSYLAGYDITPFGSGKKSSSEKPKDETNEVPEKADNNKNEKSNERPADAPEISLVSQFDSDGDGIPEYRIVGEAYDLYVVVELADRLVLIDKHAAHERIIFDELCARRKAKTKEQQMLLAPIEVIIVDDEETALSDYSEEIKQIGFDFTYDKESKTVILEALPVEIPTDAAESAFCAMLDRLSSGGTVERTEAEFFEKALYQASCKAAIKGGRHYGAEHIIWICNRILKDTGDDGTVIKTCPHGRPVAFEIKKSSIERQFLRLE